jgi:ABC-2 type transport system ATP-binding protein
VSDPGFALQIHGLTKRFGSVTALDGISMEVATGRIHGLLGPNGAGKTTLLRIMLGLVRPDSGVIRLFSRSLAEQGQTALGRVGGFVDSPAFPPYLSGRRSLELLAAMDGTARGTATRALVGNALERAGLQDTADRPVRGWSLGMRQRLGLAAALLRRPRLLVLDEPVNGLDPAGARDLWLLIRDLGADGVTILLSSHDMDDVSQLCHSVTILHRGRAEFEGSLDQLAGSAPDPSYRVATADDAAAVTQLRAVPALTVSPHPRGGMIVTGSQPDVDVAVAALVRAGNPIRALALAASPLESAFFAITGRPAGSAPHDELDHDRQPAPMAR